MKILIIGTTDILGGAAKISWEIKNALENTGHSVSMFVADKHSNNREVKIIPRQKWRKVLGFLLGTENLISTDWILNTPEFKEADLVHCHNIHGRFFNLQTLQKMSQLKPVVWTLHDEWALTPHCAYTLEGTEMENGLYVCPSIDTPPRLLWDNSRNLAKEKNTIYSNSKLHIITPSNWLKKRTEKTILAKQDIRLIPNGINTNIFTKTDKVTAREKLNLPQDKRIILFLATAGKANTWKGWKYTEEVIKHYQTNENILFLNVGNFIEEGSESNVEYRLHVSDPHQLALYYSAADILLFTSIAENFPLVILEAMSCGLPIATFDVGGVKEVVVHKENGFVGEYKNSTDLIRGIDWLFSLSENESKTLSNLSSLKIKEKYDIQLMTEKYLKLYQEII